MIDSALMWGTNHQPSTQNKRKIFMVFYKGWARVILFLSHFKEMQNSTSTSKTFPLVTDSKDQTCLCFYIAIVVRGASTSSKLSFSLHSVGIYRLSCRSDFTRNQLLWIEFLYRSKSAISTHSKDSIFWFLDNLWYIVRLNELQT